MSELEKIEFQKRICREIGECARISGYNNIFHYLKKMYQDLGEKEKSSKPAWHH